MHVLRLIIAATGENDSFIAMVRLACESARFPQSLGLLRIESAQIQEANGQRGARATDPKFVRVRASE